MQSHISILTAVYLQDRPRSITTYHVEKTVAILAVRRSSNCVEISLRIGYGAKQRKQEGWPRYPKYFITKLISEKALGLWMILRARANTETTSRMIYKLYVALKDTEDRQFCERRDETPPITCRHEIPEQPLHGTHSMPVHINPWYRATHNHHKGTGGPFRSLMYREQPASSKQSNWVSSKTDLRYGSMFKKHSF